MSGGFRIVTIVPMPFRANPYMMGIGAGRTGDHRLMWSVFDIIVLGADGKGGQREG